MEDFVLHTNTEQALADYLNAPSHALMLVGPSGSGKSSLASAMATDVLGLSTSLDNYPYKLMAAPEPGKSLGIEVVRQLEHFLSLKVPRSTAYNRVAIIDNAQTLTLEAQNALLKNLEEPPEGTVIFLNVTHIEALLPTIRSRSETLSIKKPNKEQLVQYFLNKGFNIKQVEQAYAISGGLPGLMSALLDNNEHPLLQGTVEARKLLGSSTYERLILVDELAKQRPLALDTAFILQQMAYISLQSATGASAKKWHAVLEASYKAIESLNNNGQPKLVLTNLVLSF